jgi:hypothetical protein
LGRKILFAKNTFSIVCILWRAAERCAAKCDLRLAPRGADMKRTRTNEMQGDVTIQRRETCGRRTLWVGDPRRTTETCCDWRGAPKCKTALMGKVSENCVAELADLAAWAKVPGILRVFQAAIRRPRGHVETIWGRRRCEVFTSLNSYALSSDCVIRRETAKFFVSAANAEISSTSGTRTTYLSVVCGAFAHCNSVPRRRNEFVGRLFEGQPDPTGWLDNK